jgi:hypothetical protein
MIAGTPRAEKKAVPDNCYFITTSIKPAIRESYHTKRKTFDKKNEVQINSIPSWGQEQRYLIAVQTCNTL